MQSDWILAVLSFFEGLALIVSPCILPILPIILAGSLTGSKRRPYGIIIGFVICFTLFTFFSRSIIVNSGIDATTIRHVSYVFLLLLGIVMLSTTLTEKFNLATQKLTSVGSSWSKANDNEGGFVSGLFFGALISIIWTPCAGPILAAVIVQTLVQQSSIAGFFTLLSFSIGVGLPMLLIAQFGRDFLAQMTFFRKHTDMLRKLAGLIIILGTVYIAQLDFGSRNITTTKLDIAPATMLKKGLENTYPAPSINGATAWINSPPLTMDELKGKVVLIDFWTYSCINCIRTLPYIKGWYEKYHDKGLVIIGVHSPEFEFEKNLDNVKHAVEQDGIKYPVAVDNDFTIWRHYSNRYWPAHYLINKEGQVVYTHFGEGEYEVTENNIQYLLGINDTSIITGDVKPTAANQQTPETYFGSSRAENQVDSEPLPLNGWKLAGDWKVTPEYILANTAGASLTIRFFAKNVYLVAGNDTGKAITLQVSLNGKELQSVEILHNTLYTVVEQNSAVEGVLKLTATAPGIKLYTFTFG